MATMLLCVGACQREPEPPEQVSAEAPPPKTEANDKPLILVAGVTGRQGSALAKKLVELGYPVRGSTRNPDSEKAKTMADLGIEVVKVDFRDTASLAAATEGIYGLFFYTPNSSEEVTMGQNVTDAAKASGVEHVIYTTSLSADPDNGYPIGQPKRSIELYLRDSGLGYTILRPVQFMENFDGRQSTYTNGGMSGPEEPTHLGQYISVRDIAFFAAEAFANPQEWIGKELNIAGDEMTQSNVAELFSRLLGVQVDYKQISWEQAARRMSPRLIEIFKWYESSGFKVDVQSLRNDYPNLMTLEQYLNETGWSSWGSSTE
ncbi:MAG: NmrA family NAD(P)-binding protein [Pseudomonadota bacterium]